MAGNPHIDFAGDYDLGSIVLHNHQNQGLSVRTKGTDIKHLVQELNIYESMFSNAITGTVVIADTVNLIANLPIQGTERLTFKLATPGAHKASHVVDFSEEGTPMQVYKLSNRQQGADGMQIYTLHFASREFLRNLRTKVSQAYSGRIDQMVASIMQDPNYLDSRNQLNYQKTRNQDKIVIPNKSPFSAINMLVKRAMANNSKSVGYYFYETTKGFHFRSWESMCVDELGNPRAVKQVFRYMPMKIKDPDVGDKIEHDYTSVEDYKFVNNFHDVASNTVLGTYGHRVITHNIYDKSYKTDDYHYHNSFADTKHTDGPNPAIVDTPVDYDNKSISDYPESRVTLSSTTQFAHNEDTGAFGTDVSQDGKTEGEREAQFHQQFAGTRLQLTVKGQSYLEVGDVIQFDLLSVENKLNSSGSLDPQYSGRYIIVKIRHRVGDHEFIQALECVKDSVARGFRSNKLKTFPGKLPKNDTGYLQDINQYDNIAQKVKYGVKGL